MTNKIINPRSPAAWDRRIEGAVPALRDLVPTDEERAWLEKRRVELAEMANGPGREALSEDEVWLNAQFKDEQLHGDCLTVAGLIQDIKRIQDHGEPLARALRNLGRFDEAMAIVESLPNPTRETMMLADSIRDWRAAVGAGDVECDCERTPQSYVDTKGPKFKGKHATVTITPNRRHRAERVAINGVVRWLYRCSICMALSLPDQMPERHQAVHEARAVVMSAVKQGIDVQGGVTDAELLKP